MANKLVQTCDQCQRDIEGWQDSKAVAFNNGARLSFHIWSDSLAAEKTAIHFHNDLCARDYLANWLRKQRQDASKQPERVSGWVEEAPVPAAPAETEEERLSRNIHTLGKAPVQELDLPAVEAAPANEAAADDGYPF